MHSSTDGFNDSKYSDAEKAQAWAYARAKALLEPMEDKSYSSSRRVGGISKPVFSPSQATENPFESTNTRRVTASDTGRQTLETDRGEVYYYQTYLAASSVVRKTMLSRLKEQQAEYDAEVAALLQGASLDRPSPSYDHEADQKKVEAEADQYASDYLTLAGPKQKDNMLFFKSARDEYLFCDPKRRQELTTVLKETLADRSVSNVSSGFLPQATRPVANASSRAPSITEDAYVQRAVVAFKDFGMNARDARHNYREASKNPEDLKGLEQTLIDMEAENRRSPRL